MILDFLGHTHTHSSSFLLCKHNHTELSIFSCVHQAADGSYTGFIKVHLRLSRPVTVPVLEAAGPEGVSRLTGSRRASEDQDNTDSGCAEKRTSFYLPSDCVKQLHISSLTTTKEVIQGLLKKFMVLDNPRKFALYRQTHRDGQGEEKTARHWKACFARRISNS